jgi:ABC-type antimicrobial peptide transport system permease subunit
MTGLGAGALLGWALVHASASPGFRLPYVFPVGAALAALVGVLGVTLATAYWPVQRARRRNLAGATRME